MHFITSINTKTFKKNFKNLDRKYDGIKVSDIEIAVEELTLCTKIGTQILMERPISVSGVIIPIDTKGRLSTPNPIAFNSLSKYIKTVTHAQKFSFLANDSDRGHIFALEFSAPNCQYNIIPQWSGFQEYGDWRRLERGFKKLSNTLSENGNSLFLEMHIEYLNLNMHHLHDTLANLFDFTKENSFIETKVQKCLQIFGTPTSYHYTSYPCNMHIQKPINHSLSIPYIKHLYKISCLLHESKSKAKFKTKIKAAQKKLGSEWDLKELAPEDLVNINDDILNNIELYTEQGIIALSAITEDDLN